MDSQSQRSEGSLEHHDTSWLSLKGRRPACDQCWQLHIRCMFNQGTDESCTNCVGRKFQCTWTKSARPEPALDESYTKYLEGRVKDLEKQLKQMFPGINPKRELDSLLGNESSAGSHILASQDATQDARRLPSHSAVAPQTSTPSQPTRVSPVSPTAASSHFIQKTRLADVRSEAATTDVDLHDEDTVLDATTSTREDEPRYYGRSSTEILLRDAGLLREGFIANRSPVSAQTHRRPEFWRPTTAEMRMLNSNPWEAGDDRALELPPADLIPELVDGFFARTNNLYHIMHRPLFEKQMREGLHMREPNFLRVVMLVCANGARWSNDPRVLDEEWPVPLSAGYRWFRQVKSWNKNFTYHSSLWDIQILLLTIFFLNGTSVIYGTWNINGTGIRILVDAGVHRKRSTVSIENELYKRCFWSLLLIDRFSCFVTGRQSAMQDLDLDLDDALEVDDEYWSLEPNAPPPVQPEGLPSQLAMFNRLIALCRVMGRSLQTVFALGRTKRQIGLDGPQGSAWMMQDMNAQLNIWAHATPKHLRLPPPALYHTFPFLDQAVSMWSFYFYTVQVINRQFISQASPLASSCLRICREAARACARMLDGHRSLTHGSLPMPSSFAALFSSAMVLIIDLIAQGKAGEHADGDVSGGGIRSGSGVYTAEQKREDVKRCMRVLEGGEGYFHIAGRLWDILREFEQSWRLQTSPITRCSQPGDSSESDNAWRQQQPPPFHPSESIAPPVQDSSVQLEDKADFTFDIAYPRPDTPPLTPQNDVPPVAQPATRHTSSTSQYDMSPTSLYDAAYQEGASSLDLGYTHITDHLNGAIFNSYPPQPHLVGRADTHGNLPEPFLNSYPVVAFEDFSYPVQTPEQIWNDAIQQPSRFNPTYGRQPNYMPGYGRTTFGVGSVAIPGFGIFPPGGWILGLNEATLSEDEIMVDGMGGPPKPSVLSQWEAMMQYARGQQ